MRKKILIIAAALVLAAGGTTTGVVMAMSSGPAAPAVRTLQLERRELSHTVSTTGTIYSRNASEIYSQLTTYPVREVRVEIGDRVQEGDVLAVLDVSGLESDIQQKRASVHAQQSAQQAQVDSARRELETYDRNLQSDYDEKLRSAESAVRAAELGVQSASSDAAAARRDLRDARDDGEEDSVIDAYKDAVRVAENALEKAQLTLEQAQEDLRVAKATTGDDRAAYEDALRSAQVQNNFNEQYIAISRLEADLGKAEIISPVSGIVTAVMAKEGAAASDALFVIQDPDNLKVITNIKEYDLSRVKIGDKVEIKTDATGDNVYEGTLDKIAPTSTLTNKGGPAEDSSGAEFESEVLVPSQGELYIGMNARMSIITDERSGVFCVPFEAIVEDPDTGETSVFVMRPAADGTYVAASVPVEIGLETDFESEVSSDALVEGDIVITDAQSIADGMQVEPAEGFPAPEGDAQPDAGADGGEAPDTRASDAGASEEGDA